MSCKSLRRKFSMGCLILKLLVMAETARSSCSEDFNGDLAVPFTSVDLDEIITTSRERFASDDVFDGQEPILADEEPFPEVASRVTLLDEPRASSTQGYISFYTSGGSGSSRLEVPPYGSGRSRSEEYVQELFTGREIRRLYRQRSLSVPDEFHPSLLSTKRKTFDDEGDPKELLSSAIKEEIRCKIQLKRINTGQEELKVEYSTPEPTISYDAVRKRSEVREKNKEYAKQSRDRAKEKRSRLQTDNFRLMEERETLRKEVSELKQTLDDIKTHINECKVIVRDSFEDLLGAAAQTSDEPDLSHFQFISVQSGLSATESFPIQDQFVTSSSDQSSSSAKQFQDTVTSVDNTTPLKYKDAVLMSIERDASDNESTSSSGKLSNKVIPDEVVRKTSEEDFTNTTDSLFSYFDYDDPVNAYFEEDELSNVYSSFLSEDVNSNRGDSQLSEIPSCSKHHKTPVKPSGKSKEKSHESLVKDKRSQSEPSVQSIYLKKPRAYSLPVNFHKKCKLISQN